MDWVRQMIRWFREYLPLKSSWKSKRTTAKAITTRHQNTGTFSNWGVAWRSKCVSPLLKCPTKKVDLRSKLRGVSVCFSVLEEMLRAVTWDCWKWYFITFSAPKIHKINGHLNIQSNVYYFIMLQQVNSAPANQDKQTYNICGRWDPGDPALEALNAETPRDGKIFITVAVDLVIKGIKEPVRFVIETSVRVFPQNESSWKDFYFNTRKFVQQFYLSSKEVKNEDQQ